MNVLDTTQRLCKRIDCGRPINEHSGIQTSNGDQLLCPNNTYLNDVVPWDGKDAGGAA